MKTRVSTSPPLRGLTDCAKMYARTDDLGKRLAIQAFYQRILISEDEKAAIQLNEPFAALTPTSADVRCCSTFNLVGLFSSYANELRKARRHLSTEPARELSQANGRRKRKTQPRLSDKKVGQIVTAYETGKTVYELAAEYGCHRVTISAVLKRRGVALRLQPATKVEIERMIALYQSGLSLAAVGNNLGINASTVLKYLRANGVPTRSA